MRAALPTALLAAAVALGGCGGEAAPGAAAPRVGSEVAGQPSPAAQATPAGSQVSPERPASVTLPSGRVLPVDAVGTRRDGALAVPDDVRRAGWWEGSSRLGDPFGSVVLAAHVDSFTQGVGPAAELLSARVGDRIRVAGAGRAQAYRVTSVRLVPRADLRRLAVVFSAAGPPRLVLITCGGPYDATRGGYADNVVVVARPVGVTR